MANVITSKYRSDSVSFFLEDLQNNEYYTFVSSAARSTVVNSLFSNNDFLEKTIFGKRIKADENFYYMIRNYPWQNGFVYEQYDDQIDLSDKRYYAVIYPENNNTGDYRIFKCLFNNYNAASTSPPSYNSDIEDQIYRTSDGYVWKFMYAISVTEFDKYNTLGYIPITANTLISNTDFSSSVIQEIQIQNVENNFGYEIMEGVVREVATVTVGPTTSVESLVLNPKDGFTFSEITGYYRGQYLYVTNPISSSANVYTIDSYTYDSSTKRGIVTLVGNPVQDSIIIGNISDYKIVPRIEIKGDGTGAIAVPEIITDSSIKSITVLNKGSGYTKAEANIVDPFSFDTSGINTNDRRVSLRAILSPRGGHGTNLVDELSCKHCLIFTELTQSDNNFVPITNTYSKIGLVKNPEFTSNTDIFDNRIVLEIDGAQILQQNEQVTQVNISNEVIFSATVHEVSANTVYLSEYHGPYENYANTVFSIDPDLPIRSSQGQLLEINTFIGEPIITYPKYVPKTGEVYYMTDFFPVTRTENSREQFKIILEF